MQEVGVRHRAASSEVAEEIIAWAQRKHSQIRKHHPYASLDRLPIFAGSDPELQVQLDFRYPERHGYTISMSTKGMITLQFQHMRDPLRHHRGAKANIETRLALPGVNVEERLSGRPSFPMAALANDDRPQQFIRILDDAVDQMVKGHKRSTGSNDSHDQTPQTRMS